jgi:hypothetical protein
MRIFFIKYALYCEYNFIPCKLLVVSYIGFYFRKSAVYCVFLLKYSQYIKKK